MSAPPNLAAIMAELARYDPQQAATDPDSEYRTSHEWAQHWRCSHGHASSTLTALVNCGRARTARRATVNVAGSRISVMVYAIDLPAE